MAYDSIFRPRLFNGKRIIVTGGGSGIGRATAHELAHLGAHVALVGRKKERLEKVAEEIVAAGAAAPTVHACDIRVEEEVRATVGTIGAMDALVNNAGGQFWAPLEAMSQKGWETVVRTNLTGGFLMARECYLAAMREMGGAIVNVIADMWRSMPGMGHSGAARAGMLNFTYTAAVEWGAAAVRVNAVAPGFIASSGMATYPEDRRPRIKGLRRVVPLGRLGTEAEVAAAIVFLLSPAAAFISGSCLRVDGAAPNARLDAPLPEHPAAPAYRGFPLEETPDFLREEE